MNMAPTFPSDWPPERLSEPVKATPKLPSRQGESHPLPLTEPDVNLSIHPARAIQPKAVPPTASAQTESVRAGGPDEGADMLGRGCWRAVCICASPNAPDARRDLAG